MLDHIGIPLNVGRYRDRQPMVVAEWAAAMRRLAVCANVSVKLGGFGMPFFGETRPSGDRPEEVLGSIWHPFIETVASSFGTDRCMFESNFPVDSLLCDYATLWNGFKFAVRDYSADEKAALFHRSAAAFYGFPDVA